MWLGFKEPCGWRGYIPLAIGSFGTPRHRSPSRIARARCGRAGDMMALVPGCCRARVCEEFFKPKTARRRLKQYRKKGLDVLERQMLASIAANELDGARVLEIGGGIGAMQAELLAAGAHQGE